MTFQLKSQTSSLYFTRDISTRHFINPAFQPDTKYYISLPFIGYSEGGYSNNSFSLRNLAEDELNPFYNNLKSQTNLKSDFRMNLLSLGYCWNNTFFNFNIAQKADILITAPKDLFSLIFFGTPRYDYNSFDLKGTGVSGNLYTETSFGVSQKINEQWIIGLKLKFLSGNTNINFNTNNLNVIGAVDRWNISGNAQFRYAGAITPNANNLLEINSLKFPDNISNWFKMNGTGAGIDFGVHFRMFEDLYFSFSVNDLGFIYWSKNVINNRLSIDYNFDGLLKLNSSMTTDELNSALNNISDVNLALDSLWNDIQFNIGNEVNDSYFSKTTANIYFASEYRFMDDKLSTGIVFQSFYNNGFNANKLTAILNFLPFDGINTTLSYSFLNGYNSLGGGFGIKAGPVNLFTYFDYIPTSITKIKYSDSSVYFPYNSNIFNLSAGISIAFGERERKSSFITKRRFNSRTGLYRSKFRKQNFY